MAESKYLKKTQGNGASTVLSSSITNADTAAPLTSDTAFDGEGMLLLDEGQATEEFAYGTGKVGSSITILADDRGLEGGSAQAHADTATVKGVVTSGMWNNLITAVSKLIKPTDGTLQITGTATATDILDEDTMASDSATALATQQSIKAYVDNGGVYDGWIAATDTWTYASATTFTIAGVDRTAMFPKGTKLKLTQNTTKYFYVVGSAFSTNTTITVTGGSSYSLANAAITSPYYSYASTPQGFPSFMSYTPTWDNVTIGSATVFAQFTMIGKLVWVKLSAVFAADTSISGTIGFSLPITGDTDISNNIMIGTNYAEDAGTAGYCGFIRQGSTTLANPTLYSGSFYNATVPHTWGNGDFFKCVLSYEVG